MPVNFFIQSTQTKSKHASIYVRYTEKGIDAKARTPFSIDPSRFHKGEVKMMNERSNASADKKQKIKAINANLDSIKIKIDNLKRDLNARLNDRLPTEVINTQWLKDWLKPKKDRSYFKPQTLGAYFDYFIQVKKDDIAHSTYKKNKSIGNRIKRFESENQPIYFEAITLDFKDKFKQWCDKEDYQYNTYLKTLKVIVTVCNHAREHGINVHNDSLKLTRKMKYKSTPTIYLNFEELAILLNHEYENKKLEIARDWLLITCFTGQRAGDFFRFSSKDIVNLEGTQNIEVEQSKTNVSLYIPIIDPVPQILKKYGNEFPPKFSETVESNTALFNRYVKKACQEAGINTIVEANLTKPETNRSSLRKAPKYMAVSSHVGRKSFATNYYTIIDTSTLMSLTGHTTERQLKEYVGKPPKEYVKSRYDALNSATKENFNLSPLKVIKNEQAS